MIGSIVNFITLLGSWGYLIIFLAAFLESSAFLGLLVPGESIVVIAGVLASQGYLDIGDSIAVISLGAVAGDTVGYSLGRVFGRGYFERHGRLFLIKAAHLKKADDYFRRHGGKTIFFGRFIGFFRALAPFAAGVSRMPYGRFLVFNVTGGVLWATTFTLIGYFFGRSWQAIEHWVGRAGIFVFFLLCLIIGLAYLYRTLLKRQDELYSWFRKKYTYIVSSPRIKTFSLNHPSLVTFLTERLSPRKYLGLHLSLGLLLSAIFITAFGVIIDGILSGGPLAVLDRWVIENVLYFTTPQVTDAVRAFTLMGSPVFILFGSTALSAYFFIKKRSDLLVTLLASVLGGGVLTLILRVALQRSRPEDMFLKPPLFAFSDSPDILSVVFYGIVAYFLIRNTKSWRLQLLTLLAAFFMVFLIGFTGIYLQTRYLSDILAGYAGGLFWLTVCITGLEIYRKRVAHKSLST